MKRTRGPRRKVLLTAWSNMAPSHHSDFEAFIKELEHRQEAGTRFKDAFMFSEINQETLLKRKTKPLFM